MSGKSSAATFSTKPASLKSNSSRPSSGKSKPNSSKKSSAKKSSPKQNNGRGRGIEQNVIQENNGIVEAHWQLESSVRGNRSVPYSMRSVATRDQSLDPIISFRGNNFKDGRDGLSSRTFGKIDKEKDDDDDDAEGNRFCRTIKSHKKCLIVGFALFLIVDFILLGVFFAPGRKKENVSNNTANAASSGDPGEASNDGNTVVGTTGNSPDAAPTDNIFTPDEPSSADETSEVDTDIPTMTPTDGVDFWTNSETLAPFDVDGSSDEDYSKTGRYQLLETVPHDTRAFTQGLEILSRDKIEVLKDWQTPFRRMLRSGSHRSLASSSSYYVESTGQYGDSDIRIVKLATGEVIQQLDLGDEYFGEGCTYYSVPNTDANGNDVVRIVQVTWKELRGFVYELSVPSTITPTTQLSLSRIGEFEISEDDHTRGGKMWGIVFHPIRNQFLVSDGTRFLYVWELTETTTGSGITFDFMKVDSLNVRINRSASEWTGLPQINELEWDPYSYGGNTILANVWQTNEIVRIYVGGDSDPEIEDPEVGKVTHIYDLSDLEALAQPEKRGAVLNGIAFVYDSGGDNNGDFLAYSDQFWVTGKYWPSMYRIELLDN